LPPRPGFTGLDVGREGLTSIHDSSTEEAAASSAGVPIRERYGLVLTFMLGGYVLSGIEDNRWVAIINVVLLTTVSLGWVTTDIAEGTRFLLLAVAQLAALLAILNRIAQHERVSFQTVMGAVASYALIAFVMAAIFHGLELLSDSTSTSPS
jgi:hypothetical protein